MPFPNSPVDGSFYQNPTSGAKYKYIASEKAWVIDTTAPVMVINHSWMVTDPARQGYLDPATLPTGLIVLAEDDNAWYENRWDAVAAQKKWARVSGGATSFEWTIDPSAVEDDIWSFVQGISPANNVYRITVKDKDNSGVVYEFELIVSNGAPIRINLGTVLPASNHFKEVGARWWGGSVRVGFKTASGAVGATYIIEIETPFPDAANSILPDNTKMDALVDPQDVTHYYPSDAMQQFMAELNANGHLISANKGTDPTHALRRDQITWGTAAPTGGVDGDIYIQI